MMSALCTSLEGVASRTCMSTETSMVGGCAIQLAVTVPGAGAMWATTGTTGSAQSKSTRTIAAYFSTSMHIFVDALDGTTVATSGSTTSSATSGMIKSAPSGSMGNTATQTSSTMDRSTVIGNATPLGAATALTSPMWATITMTSSAQCG